MSSFPAGFVDRIFAKLSITYGRDFTARWEGLDARDIKEDWRCELDGFERFPHAIAYALKHLPEKPPTVLEFRALCRQAPEEPAPRLDPPPTRGPTPAELEALKRLRNDIASGTYFAKPSREWAYRLVQRVANGEIAPSGALKMAREVIANDLGNAP
jgi:hypothetical protein